MSFKEINPQQNFPELEEEILKFWEKNDIFKKSLKKNKDKDKFIFYEGPPTANGRPGIHHILARAFKDIIPRYKTMKGFYVGRQAGWDTHGLPVEIEVEKALGISGKKQIEKYGVAKFNQKCRESVWKYKEEWEKLTKRIGFWIDLENAYITYENSYIEKVWGILKTIWDKGLIYQDYKVVPYCPRCGTTLSSHEVAQGYKNIEDESIYVKFRLKSDSDSATYFLVWTTTPWTLPANAALAVGLDFDYVKIKIDESYLILAKDRLKVIGEKYEIVQELKGKELEGLSYFGLYPETAELTENKVGLYFVQSADFVTVADGAGIVHVAPAFGEDDMILRLEKKLPLIKTINDDGTIINGFNIPGEGKFLKDANQDIKENLEKRGLLLKYEIIKHDYPFCWRCDSMLIYYAKSTWFIAMSRLKNNLIENNEEINWIPDYIKHGRFGEWLKEVKDWALSRERYWGTPLPIWICECGQKIMIGSVKELKEKAVSKVSDDLHKPYIDDVNIRCPECSAGAKRVSEVIDVWFDAGSMPFAAGEYPANYPADYISEAVDQTRGWFYTLLAISTLLEKGSSYKNVICLAHVLDQNGKKMSKSRGNIIDPWTIIEKYGVDSLRWYFFTVNNPGDPKRLGEQNIADTLRKFELILWNVYSFFITFANIDNWNSKEIIKSDNVLDRWILSKINELNINAQKNLDNLNVVNAARAIQDFNNDLSTWYLRRSRKRRDTKFYSTLYLILTNFTKIIAPFVPFISEAIYKNLRLDKDPESVHLCDWPTAGKVDRKLLLDMARARSIVQDAHALRSAQNIRVRQPLTELKYPDKLPSEIEEIIKDEVNVLKVTSIQKGEVELDTNITLGLKQLGQLRDIIRLIQDLRKKAGLIPSDQAQIFFEADENLKNLIITNQKDIERDAHISLINKKQIAQFSTEIEIDSQKIWLGL